MGELEEKLGAILGNPAEMEKITALAAQLMGTQAPDGQPQAKPESTGGFDAELLSKAAGLLSKAGSASRYDALIRALSPYLSPARRGKLSRAVSLAKVARLAREAIREQGGNEHV